MFVEFKFSFRYVYNFLMFYKSKWERIYLFGKKYVKNKFLSVFGIGNLISVFVRGILVMVYFF